MEETDVPQFKRLSLSSTHKLNKLVPVLLVTTLLGLFAGGFFFYKYQIEGTKNDPLHHTKTNTQAQNKEDPQKVISEVGKLIKLPTGEDPTLATVTDITKLQDQPFFKNSKNGDEILIYTQAKKIILYDPTTHQIVDVATLNINSANQSTPQQKPAKIVIRNGTSVAGLASKTEAQIKKNFPDADIVNRDNASRDNYDKTLVISLNDGAKAAASNLAKPFNATLSDLPHGEAIPQGADLLVIVGKDQSLP